MLITIIIYMNDIHQSGLRSLMHHAGDTFMRSRAAPKGYLKQDRASHLMRRRELTHPQAALAKRAALWKQYIRNGAHTFEVIGRTTQMIGSKVLLELFSFAAKQNYAMKDVGRRRWVGRKKGQCSGDLEDFYLCGRAQTHKKT